MLQFFLLLFFRNAAKFSQLNTKYIQLRQKIVAIYVEKVCCSFVVCKSPEKFGLLFFLLN